jgi:hypothetical protein
MKADILNFPSTASKEKASSYPSGDPLSRKAGAQAERTLETGCQKDKKNPITRSSWIASVKYHEGFLVAFTKSGGAFIFQGVEPEVCGLVLAGTGGKSVGHALHQLLREKREDGSLGIWKYNYQFVKDEKEVKQLKEMMQ